MLQDLLSELADAGVLGVEISKIPRMRRNTHSYRLHEGEGEEEMGHSTDRYSSNLHFLLLPCATFILNQECATAQHNSGKKKKSPKSVPTN